MQNYCGNSTPILQIYFESFFGKTLDWKEMFDISKGNFSYFS